MQTLNKKGLSEVVQTSLIILLSISAIFTMWSYIGDLTQDFEETLSPAVGCIQQESNAKEACINQDGKVEATIDIALGESITKTEFNLNGESFSCSSNSCASCSLTEKQGITTIYLNPLNPLSTENTLITKINGCAPQAVQLTNC